MARYKIFADDIDEGRMICLHLTQLDENGKAVDPDAWDVAYLAFPSWEFDKDLGSYMRSRKPVYDRARAIMQAGHPWNAREAAEKVQGHIIEM